GDHPRAVPLVPRLRHQAADTVARLARCGRPAVPAEVVADSHAGPRARADRPLRQLRRRRPARRARSAAEASPGVMAEPILSIRDLAVEFKTDDGIVHAVDGISYDVFP